MQSIKQLTEQQQRVLLAHHYAQMPLAEIASWMGISQRTVRTHLERAEEKLRQDLAAAGIIMVAFLSGSGAGTATQVAASRPQPHGRHQPGAPTAGAADDGAVISLDRLRPATARAGHLSPRRTVVLNDHRALFGADHAYVQPHSGIDANLVAFWAILAHRVEEPAVRAAGVGHVNDLAGAGKLFDQANYGTDPESGLLDYDAIAVQAREFRSLVLLAGYSAYPRDPDFGLLREIADEVGATFMVDMAHFAGLVAGGVLTGDLDPVPHAEVVTSTTHKSLRGPRGGFVLCTGEYAPFAGKGCPMVLGGPLPHVMAAKAVAFAEARQPSFAAYASGIIANSKALAGGLLRRGTRLVTGGTDNHLVLADVAASFGLTGRQAESALLEAGAVTNRNSVPGDRNGAWYTSGVRLGTPALTTLGFGPDELDEIAGIITTALRATVPASATAKARYTLDAKVAEQCRARCADLLARHPLYPAIQL